MSWLLTGSAEEIEQARAVAVEGETFTAAAAASGTHKRPQLHVDGERYDLKAANKADASVAQALARLQAWCIRYVEARSMLPNVRKTRERQAESPRFCCCPRLAAAKQGA